jgi:hypothetical protein
MSLRGYEFVTNIQAADVVVAVDPSGREVALYGAELLGNADHDRRPFLNVARVSVACCDGALVRLAKRVEAIKGSCDFIC